MSLVLLLGGVPGTPPVTGPVVLTGAVRDSLELYVEVVKPDGRRYRWDGDGFAEDVPLGIQFSSKRMEGFSTASLTLSRRIDEDHPDIELRDELTIYSASGDTVWEGRVSAAPRSLDDSHSIDVQAVGWVAHMRDRKFQEIYVDRDLSRWGSPSTLRKDALNANFRATDPSVSDRIRTSVSGPWTTTPGRVTSEAWYDANGIAIGEIQYFWTRGAHPNVLNADTNWTWVAVLSTDRVGTTVDTTANLRAAGPGSGSLSATDSDRLFAIVAMSYANVAAGDSREYPIDWGPIGVYGTSGVPTHAISGEPDGVYASEVLEHILRTYCPKLTWAGNDTTYPISQLAFRDLVDPYDAFLEINRFHLLELACWEDRKVYWSPADLTDWDWEIRLDDPGVKIVLEGDSDDGSGFNGIVIQYTDLATGETRFLYPDDHSELRDDDELNPANRHGYPHWTDETLSTPCLEGDALQIGRAILAERNLPKSPGQYNLSGGYVRDRQGNWQPGWKVRATDRIVIVDHPNRRPRFIEEASWSHDSKTLTIATDMPIQTVDGYLDRLASAQAANSL